MKLLPKILSQNSEERRNEMYRQLMRREARKGGRLFGPVSAGHRREFFCLDEHTWVWHEEWTDEAGRHQAVTTRYDIRPSGVLKSQGTNFYQEVTGDELRHLYRAAKLFRAQLAAELQAL